MATLTCNNITSRAGSGSITISHTAIPNADTFEVASLGSIGIEFDMEEEGNASDSIFFLPGRFEFTAFDRMGSGDSLFEALENVDSTERIAVSLSFTTDGAWSFTDDIITFTTNDLKYDYEKRTVSFDCVYTISNTVSIGDYFLSHSDDVYTLRLATTAATDCMPAKLFIDNVLDDVFTSGTVINNAGHFSASPFSGDSWAIVNTVTSTDPSIKAQNVLQALYRLAAVDASIVGAMMGHAFFCHRRDDSDTVSLSLDDIETLQIEPGLKNYRSINALFFSNQPGVGTRQWGSPYSLYETLNRWAVKDLEIVFHVGELQPVTYNASESEFDDDGFVFTNPTTSDTTKDLSEGVRGFSVDTNLSANEGDLFTFIDKWEVLVIDRSVGSFVNLVNPLRRDVPAGTQINLFINTAERQSLSENATKAYAKAYGADGSRRITTTILDVDSMKPYQTFNLGASAPSFLQGLTFRPSKISYDLTADKIEVEAYEI